MKLKLSTSIKVKREKAIAELMKPALLDYIAKPLVTFNYIDSKPEVWAVDKYRVKMKLFNFISLGEQTINIELPDNNPRSVFTVRDNGYGTFVKKWDHWIFIEEGQKDSIKYTDEVTIEAGFFTLFVYLFAYLFYSHRQRRWKRLSQLDFNTLK